MRVDYVICDLCLAEYESRPASGRYTNDYATFDACATHLSYAKKAGHQIEKFEHSANLDVEAIDIEAIGQGDDHAFEFKLGAKRLTGNNGGDTLEITELPDGMVHLLLEHSCLTLVDRPVPIEVITSLLGGVIMNHRGIKEAFEAEVAWPRKYKNKLMEKM